MKTRPPRKTVTMLCLLWFAALFAPGLCLGQPPVISECPSDDAQVGAPYQHTFEVFGGQAPFFWEVFSEGTWLQIDGNGTLSGVPDFPGFFGFQVVVYDSQDSMAYRDCQIFIQEPASPPPTLSQCPSDDPQVGVFFEYTFQAMDGEPPYSWQIETLESWLSIDQNGTVSGTPDTPGHAAFMVFVSDSRDSMAYRDCQLFVQAQPLVIHESAPPCPLPSGTVGESYAQTDGFQASGGVLPYTWSVQNLVFGLDIDPISGHITGTPTTAGDYSFVVEVVDDEGLTATRFCSITIDESQVEALVMDESVPSCPLPQGQVGLDYLQLEPFQASGGVPPYTWLAEGLPSGLAIIPSTGRITGTPESAGGFDFLVVVSDDQESQADRLCSITILEAQQPPAPLIGACPSHDAQVNVEYAYTFTATGGVRENFWTLADQPSWMSIDDLGTLSGIPTESGFADFRVIVSDSRDSSSFRDCSISIQAEEPPAPTVSSCPTSAAKVGVPYQHTFTATGGVGPYDWALSQGPSWLEMGTGGTLSGVPSESGPADFVVTVTDSRDSLSSRDCTITVEEADAPAPTISDCPGAEAVVGTPYRHTFTATGGEEPYTWELVTSASWLSLDSEGTLSGVPVSSGTAGYRVLVTDSRDSAGARDCSIPVLDSASVSDEPISIFPEYPIGIIDETRPAFIFSTSGSIQDGPSTEGRFELSLWPIFSGQTLDDATTNIPIFTLSDLSESPVEFPAVIEDLVEGIEYVYLIQIVSPDGLDVTALSSYVVFVVEEDEETDSGPVVTVPGGYDGDAHVSLVSPGRPCREPTQSGSYSSYTTDRVFEVQVDPGITALMIEVWFVSCGRVPIYDAVESYPTISLHVPLTESTPRVPFALTESGSGNTVSLVLPDFTADFHCGGAYVWTATGITADGESVPADEYHCFRNGNCDYKKTASSWPDEETGDDGVTGTPEEGDADDTVTGETREPPHEPDQPPPPEEPRIPREPPVLECDTCLVAIASEDCDSIKVEPIGPRDLTPYDYPRAVPLMVRGDDTDYVITHCQNCGESHFKHVVKDDIASYAWDLLGKGSLNQPFKNFEAAQAKLDSLQATLEAKEEELADTKKKIDDLGKKIEKFKDKKNDAEAKVDSLARVAERAKRKAEDLRKELQTIRTDLDETEAAIDEARGSVAALEDSLRSRASSRERQLHDRLQAKRGELDAANLDLIRVTQELQNQTTARTQELKALQDDVDASRANLDALVGNLSSQQEEISNLLVRLYAAMPAMRGFRTSYANFIFGYCGAHAGSANQALFRFLELSRPFMRAGKDRRQTIYPDLTAQLETMMNLVGNCCTPGDWACQTRLGQLRLKRLELEQELDTWRDRGPRDTLLLQQLETRSQQLNADQRAIDALTADIEVKERALGQKLAEFTNFVEAANRQQDAVQSLIRDLVQEVDALQEELEAAIQARKEAHEKKRPGWERNIEDLLEELAALDGTQRGQARNLGLATDSLSVASADSLQAAQEAAAAKEAKETLETYIRDLEKDLDTAKNTEKDLGKEIEDLKKTIEKLLEELKKAKKDSGNKAAGGQTVYYIPPPVEILIAESEKKQKEFDELKAKVLAAQMLAEAAAGDFGAWQATKYGMFEAFARDVYRGKRLQMEKGALASRKAALEGKLSSLKTELKQKELSGYKDVAADYDSTLSEVAEDVEDLDEKLRKVEEAIRKLEEETIPAVKDSIEAQEEEASKWRDTIKSRTAEIKHQTGQRQRAEGTFERRRGEYLDAREKKAAAENALRGARSRVSSGVAADDAQTASAGRAELERAGGQHRLHAETAESRINQLKSTAGSIHALRTANALSQAALDSSQVELGLVENALRLTYVELERHREQLRALKNVLRKLKQERDGLESKKEELQEEKDQRMGAHNQNVDATINNREEVKALKQEIEGLEKSIIEKAEAILRTEAKLSDHAAKPKDVKKELKEKAEEKKEAHEEAREELRLWLIDFIEHISYTDTLDIEVDDSALIFDDKKRKAKRAFLVTYKGWDVSLRIKGLDGAKGADAKTFADCNPSQSWIAQPDIPEPAKAGPGREPRTELLFFEKGRLLWPEWHQAPGGPLYKNEVVSITRLFTDTDQQKNLCASEICEDDLKIVSRPDVVYTQFVGAEFTHTEDAEEVFFKVPEVPKVKCDIKEQFKAFGNDSKLMAADPSKESKIEYLHKHAIFVEKVDSTLVAARDDTLVVKIRLSDTGAKGTPDEDIRVYFTKVEPKDQEGHGLDAVGTVDTVYTTDGEGYIEFEILTGHDFGKYELTVDWIRSEGNDKPCETFIIKIDTPLIHQFVALGKGPHPLTGDLKAAWENGATALASIPAEADTSEGNSKIRFVTALRDAKGEEVNDIEIEFEGKTPVGPVEFSPETKASEWWGIARAIVEDDPDTSISATATLKDKDLHPYTHVPRVDGDYQGASENRFQIGIQEAYFTVETEEPFAPGDPINGSGHLVFEELVPELQDLLEKLGALTLDISEVITNEELIANQGTVTWRGDGGFSCTLAERFTFEISAIGVEANKGGLLDGTVQFQPADTTQALTVVFEAYIGGAGDFIADIKSAPEVDFGFVLVKEGASAVLDMSRKDVALSAPVGEEGHAWMGLYLRRLDVALPKVLKSDAGIDDAPGFVAEGFYFDQSGANGSLAVYNIAKDVSLFGFSCSVDTLQVELEKSRLKKCGIAVSVDLRDPVHGTLGMSLTVTDALAVSGTIRTENPLAIPKWDLVLDLQQGCTFTRDSEGAKITLNFLAKSEYFNELRVEGFTIDSDFNIDIEGAGYKGKPEKFMKAFKYQIEDLNLSSIQENGEKKYKLGIKGNIEFPELGMFGADVALIEGPALEVNEIEVHYAPESKPVEVHVTVAFKEREFKGDAVIKIKPAVDLSGMFVIGSADDGNGAYYDYWYGELALGFPPPGIVLGTTGLSLFKIGGGVGVHYRPPVGDDPGGPDPQVPIGLKAMCEIGLPPRGEAMNSRLTMVFAPPRFILNGKMWVMDMEENCYGEGQINIVWSPVNKIDGFVRSKVALPTAAGELIDFNGDIGYCFGACGEHTFFIRSRTLKGTAIKIVNAEGVIDIDDQRCYLSGELSYGIEAEVGKWGLTFYVNAGLKAEGEIAICYAHNVTASARAAFSGWADVELLSFNILSGKVSTELGLGYNREICVAGNIHVDYSVLFVSGSGDLDLAYPDGCVPYRGCADAH